MGVNGVRLLDLLFRQPLVSARLVSEALGISTPTAGKLLEQFMQLGILEETTGGQRNRRYRCSPYVALFTDSAMPSEPPPLQITESAAP